MGIPFEEVEGPVDEATGAVDTLKSERGLMELAAREAKELKDMLYLKLGKRKYWYKKASTSIYTSLLIFDQEL